MSFLTATRLTQFDVVVTEEPPPPALIDNSTLCYHHGTDTIPGNVGFFKQCKRRLIGRHVTISKRVPSTQHLTLCEVQVYGVQTFGRYISKFMNDRPATEIPLVLDWKYQLISSNCLD